MKWIEFFLILMTLIFCSLTALKAEYKFSLIDDNCSFNVAEDIGNERQIKEIRAKKSPEKARYISAVPGLLIHGLGHMYAGDYNTGTLLFLLEGVSIAMIMSPFITGGFDYILLVMLGGGVLFWGTYIWDVMGAPKAAQEYNKKYFPDNNTTFQEHKFPKTIPGLTFSIKF